MSDGNYINLNYEISPDTVYWFAPGVHTLGDGTFDEIQPANGDTFIGAPGAVIDGQGTEQAAFAQEASNVTIEYLTIQNFVPPAGQYAVNHDEGPDWALEYDTLQDIGGGTGSQLGAAFGLGDGNVAEYNCFTQDGQYAVNAGGTGTTFDYNEVSWSGAAFFPDDSCGCSGGIKYWDATNANIVGNYIHDNYNVGLWVDTDNSGFLIQDNYIARNWAQGIIYEISYNGLITGNTFLDNGWGATVPAIYLSSSGGDPYVSSNYAGQLTVSDNSFVDNWSGVVVYQDADRYCDGVNNASTGFCTLDDPSIYSATNNFGNLTANASAGDTTIYTSASVPVGSWVAFNLSLPAVGNSGPAYQVTSVSSSGSGFALSLASGIGSSEGSGAPVYQEGSCQSSGGPWAMNTSSSPQSQNPPDQAPYDYFDYCQWKAENVSVADNTFDFDPTDVETGSLGFGSAYNQGPTCPSSDLLDPSTNPNFCGLNALYGFSGSEFPVGGSDVVPEAMMSRNGNNLNGNGEAPDNDIWSGNTYCITGTSTCGTADDDVGFMAYRQGPTQPSGDSTTLTVTENCSTSSPCSTLETSSAIFPGMSIGIGNDVYGAAVTAESGSGPYTITVSPPLTMTEAAGTEIDWQGPVFATLSQWQSIWGQD